jgi:hypothetical protein
MVENIKKILLKLNDQQKPVWLLALLKMDELVDRWSLIISAPWANEQNRDKEFGNILALLKETLTNEESSSIARVNFMNKEDHLIEQLLKKNTGDVIKSETVNGNTVHEGYIIESNPSLVASNDLFTTTPDPSAQL